MSIGSYLAVSFIALENELLAIEGLVVDAINWGIGIRNHTAPSLAEFGATWSEDILFVEPEIQCVNTNLTIDFQVPETQSESRSGLQELPINVRLKDHGSFANLPRIRGGPHWNRDTDTQSNPKLWERAYRAACSIMPLQPHL